MNWRDKEDDGEMVALNMQIKSVLAKVSYYLMFYLLACRSKYFFTMFFLTHAETDILLGISESIPSFSMEQSKRNSANCIL